MQLFFTAASGQIPLPQPGAVSSLYTQWSSTVRNRISSQQEQHSNLVGWGRCCPPHGPGHSRSTRTLPSPQRCWQLPQILCALCCKTLQSFCLLSLDTDQGKRKESIKSDKTCSFYLSIEIVLFNYTFRSEAFHLLHTRAVAVEKAT